ncbi:MAG: phosphonate C-P lyase system protein PhnG [Zoogloeaceae bacterium]|jgi:alpha-D-ribose 1-methylphosphonate 5-triphosphate synthase subunit PhnG|nr:phosphonate C-P lyase system protein PhnG [Zoogloeaceae bacterium]
MNTRTHPDTETLEVKARQRWMYALAHAKLSELEVFEPALKAAAWQLIRPPETGMAMLRGRMGATGASFNLGEMTVTRCVVRNHENRTGYSYIAGRGKKHAELAALADAHLQGERQAFWLGEMIESLTAQRHARVSQQEKEAARTQVDFFTLARGENDA